MQNIIDENIINEEQLNSILELDPVEMGELILDVFKSVDESVKRLSQLHDREQIAFIAHSMKGETSNFGLVGLSQLFTTIEKKELESENFKKLLAEISKINSKSKKEFETKYQR